MRHAIVDGRSAARDAKFAIAIQNRPDYFNRPPEAPGHSEAHAVSISGEAVEQAGAARGHQIRLTAASAWVRRIPRRVATAGAIMMAYHCATRGRLALSPRVGSAARPVGAGGIDCITRQCLAVRVRPGQDIMLVGLIASAVDRLALFVKREFLVNAVTVALNVPMQIGYILSDDGSFGIVPGTIANAIAGVHRRLTAGSGGAEVSPPRSTAGSRSLGKGLAVLIGACQTTKIGSIPRTHAGDEETHGLSLLLCSRLPEPHIRRAQQYRGKDS
jgi:hypothetical protein